MRVLVACEYSGRVRDAFIRNGHDALSCDVLPTDAPGPHYEGDVRDVLYDGWDLLVGHPPCTFMANSGARHLYLPGGARNESRWDQMREAAAFFKLLLDAPIPRVAIENPIMVGHAKQLIGVHQTQVIQPWQFGHGETKATCLWLRGLPPLRPTSIVEGRAQTVHMLPPSANRWKLRSTTYQGIADAMADQWSIIDAPLIQTAVALW